MRIEYLSDHPEVIPTLASWHHKQFGYLNPGGSLEQVKVHLRSHTGRCQIPTTLVMLEDSELLGSASLVASDMDTHPELGPWLASVYVAPAYRRQGIGSALVERIMEEARALGEDALYLYTPDKEAFYRRRGWTVVGHEHYRDTDVAVMMARLVASEPAHASED